MTRLLLCIVFVCFLSEAVSLATPPEQQSSEKQTDWDRFRGMARTRFGNRTIDGFSDPTDSKNARFGSGSQFGPNSSLWKIDAETPSSRFFTPPEIRPLLPSDFLGQRVGSPSEKDGSANTIAPAARTNSTQPIRRPKGYFDRFAKPDITQPPAVVSRDELNQLPGQQRWFRDLGRSTGNQSTPNAANASGVFSVGSERLVPPTPSSSGAAVSSTSQSMPVNPAVANRQFEQMLENTVLSASSVHFLSPVQIAYQNGVATVRGVVASQADKIAVGNILLQNPAVRQVNNLISVVPLDPGQNTSVIEVRE